MATLHDSQLLDGGLDNGVADTDGGVVEVVTDALLHLPHFQHPFNNFPTLIFIVWTIIIQCIHSVFS